MYTYLFETEWWRHSTYPEFLAFKTENAPYLGVSLPNLLWAGSNDFRIFLTPQISQNCLPSEISSH